jgi:hypothetical protein
MNTNKKENTMNKQIILAVEVDADGNDLQISSHFWHPQTDIQSKLQQLKYDVANDCWTTWGSANKRKFVSQAQQQGHSIDFRLCDIPK